MLNEPLPLFRSVRADAVVRASSPQPEREFVRAVAVSGLRVADASGLVLRAWVTGEVSSSCLLAFITNCLDDGSGTVFYMPELASNTPDKKWLMHWASIVVSTADDIDKIIRNVSWDDISMRLFLAIVNEDESRSCQRLEWHDCRRRAQLLDNCAFAIVHEDCEECSVFGQGKTPSLLYESLVGK